MMEESTKLIITVSLGAGGDDFLDKVIEAVNNQETVLVQVAGEYGHLYVEDIEQLEEDQ